MSLILVLIGLDIMSTFLSPVLAAVILSAPLESLSANKPEPSLALSNPAINSGALACIIVRAL